MLVGLNNANRAYKPSFRANLEVKNGFETSDCSSLVFMEIPIPTPSRYNNMLDVGENIHEACNFIGEVKEKFAQKTKDSSGTLRLSVDCDKIGDRMRKNMDYDYVDKDGNPKQFSVKLDWANYYRRHYSTRGWKHNRSMTVKNSDESAQMLKEALDAFEYRVPLVEQVRENCKPLDAAIEQKEKAIERKENELEAYKQTMNKQIASLENEKRNIRNKAYEEAEREKPFPFFVSENSRRGIFGLPEKYNVF